MNYSRSPVPTTNSTPPNSTMYVASLITIDYAKLIHSRTSSTKPLPATAKLLPICNQTQTLQRPKETASHCSTLCCRASIPDPCRDGRSSQMFLWKLDPTSRYLSMAIYCSSDKSRHGVAMSGSVERPPRLLKESLP